MHDGLVLFIALLVCYLPGLALMAALGVRSGVPERSLGRCRPAGEPAGGRRTSRLPRSAMRWAARWAVLCGHLDPQKSLGQAFAAALVALGVVAVIALRRGFGPVTAWAAWSLVTIGAFLHPGSGAVSLITAFFYNAQMRVWSHVSLLAPVLAALGVVLTASWCAVWLRRHPRSRPGRRAALLVVLA